MVYPPTSEPHISVASPITASLVSPLPVPTHGAGGTFTVLTRTIISAPPSDVLSLIRDTSTWPTWNSFCPVAVFAPRKTEVPECDDFNIPTGIEGLLDLGSEITIDVHLQGDGLVEGSKRTRTQNLCVTRLERIDEEKRKGYRIAWKPVGFSNWQFHSERVMEMIEVDRGTKTDYVCWETFGGMLGPMIRMMMGLQLVDRFGDYSRDLRQYFAEKRRKRLA